jgi:hypothetical protein
MNKTKLKLLNICKPVSREEAKRRDVLWQELKLKELLDNVKKTKLPDGTWHVHDNLLISDRRVTTLKPLNVSIVDGYFDCSDNKLTSLEGCPIKIRGTFSCSANQLTSLEGCPKEIGGYFECSYNKLISLEGCPKEVGGNFNCAANKLTSLKGCPIIVNGYFNCAANNLASLKGCPKEVGGNFRCCNNSRQFYNSDIKSICIVRELIIL